MKPTDATSHTDPYCGNCGYVLRGVTESSKCPECGKPLVEVLMRPAFDRKRSIRYQSTATFMGVPLISIASGKYGPEKLGRATGVIAIGDIATGVVAIGLFARGVLAIGVVPIGVVALGSFAVGFVALGGAAVGAIAFGGIAFGGVAIGGFAVGFLKAIGGYMYKIAL